MFTIDLTRICTFTLSGAADFVQFWARYYKDNIREPGSKQRIDYISELSVNGQLTEENARRLLRWKDRRFLTDPFQSGKQRGQPNVLVSAVLSKITDLNAFRTGNLSEKDFASTVANLFPTWLIWRIFLFHICRPLEYPIADQHVFRTFECHTGCTLPQSWDKYLQYRRYFEGIVNACNFPGTGGQIEAIRNRKQVDNALTAFGQFLLKYRKKTG